MSFKETEVGKIPQEWHVKMIQEIGEVVSGGTPKTKETSYWNGNISWITPKDLANFDERYIERGERSITEEGFNNSSTKLLPKGTVLFSSRAPIGYLAIAKKELCTNQGFKNIVCNKKYSDNEFLYYMMKNRTKEIKNIAGGSTFKEVSAKVIKGFKIPVPPVEEQKAIAHILSTLDEKIETNNQINKKLEEMAQAIFKRWFVDFEFPCIPKNYKFLGSGKPCNPRGSGKPDDYDKVLTYNRVGGLPVPDGKSWFVYVLLCDDGSFYKGMTKDLYRRFYEHYTGIGAEWTKIHKPVKVIHYEKFNSQQEARKREEELKSGYGREWIKREYKKYQEGSPAHKMKEGLLAHEMKAGLSDHEMKAGSPAHQTRLMIAGEMVESELGMIPKGWEVSTVGELAEVVSKGTTPRKGDIDKANDDKTVKFIKVKDIGDDGIIDLHSLEHIPKSIHLNQLKRSVLEYKDVLISIAGTIGRVSYVNDDLINANINQAVAFIRLKDIEKHFLFILYKFKSNEFQDSLSSKVVQGVQANISLTVIKNEKLLISKSDMLLKYNIFMNSIFNKKDVIIRENNNLKNIRDTLLPKLMSGEIRVPLDN